MTKILPIWGRTPILSSEGHMIHIVKITICCMLYGKIVYCSMKMALNVATIFCCFCCCYFHSYSFFSLSLSAHDQRTGTQYALARNKSTLKSRTNTQNWWRRGKMWKVCVYNNSRYFIAYLLFKIPKFPARAK